MPLPGVPAGCVHVREAQVEIPAFAAAALRLPDPFVLIHEAGEVRLRLLRQRAHAAATDGAEDPQRRASRSADAGTERSATSRCGTERFSTGTTPGSPYRKYKNT